MIPNYLHVGKVFIDANNQIKIFLRVDGKEPPKIMSLKSLYNYA